MRIDTFLFGGKRFRVDKGDVSRVAGRFISLGLTAKFSGDGEFTVPLFRLKKYRSALSGIEYTEEEIKCLPAFAINLSKRRGILAALLIVSVYMIFSSLFVWDVRVSGNEEVPTAAVEEELAAAGLSVGASWRSLSFSEVERSTLEKSEKIGWLNINRRGNVAYVTVKEKTVYEQSDDSGLYSNLVASRDCVIEEITVKQGIAHVKAGDTVKAGQLLISGVIPAELGGGFVRAEGEILGSFSEEISVEVPRRESFKSYGEEKLLSVRVKIFKFSINIFKNYRKSNNDCVIIEDVKECTVLGKYRLPFGIYKTYSADVAVNERTYSDKELLTVASSRLAKLRIMKLSDSELIKIRTYGEFTDGGYRMASTVSQLKDVGEERFISN